MIVLCVHWRNNRVTSEGAAKLAEVFASHPGSTPVVMVVGHQTVKLQVEVEDSRRMREEARLATAEPELFFHVLDSETEHPFDGDSLNYLFESFPDTQVEEANA